MSSSLMMRIKSLSWTTRILLALPLVGVGGWSANAAMLRSRSSSSLEFVVGSIDDTVAETLHTGDLVFFTNKLRTMQPGAALYTWLMRRRLDPQYDHCGVVFVDGLGHPFVVEETLRQVHCRPYAARILLSQAQEIVVVPLQVPEHLRSSEFQQRAQAFVQANTGRTSRLSLRRTLSAWISPETFAASTKDPPLVPSAAFIVDAYEALGIVDPQHLVPTKPHVTKATIMPRHLLTRGVHKVAFQLADYMHEQEQEQESTSGSIGLGKPIPIRLY